MTSTIQQGPDHISQLDPMLRALLPVLRCFQQAFRDPASSSWRHGYDAALSVWGEARGLAIAHAVQKLTYDLVQSDVRVLQFHDPSDVQAQEILTRDEKQILALLAYMRAENVPAARAIIAELYDGRIDPTLLRHGLSLSGMLDAAPARMARPKLKPKLKIVR